MPETYTVAQYADDLRRIAGETTDEGEIFDRLGPLSQRLAADRGWLEDRFFEPDKETGFSAFLLHEEDDHSLAVLAVSWVPGMGIAPHDHGTWALVAGVEGIERNIRYKRLDDRADPAYAELAIKSEVDAGPCDLVCVRTGGIHSVHNRGEEVTLSVHTYGRHINHTQRSQFDIDARTAKEFKLDMK